MQRLIEEAANMTEEQEKLGITVDASSMSFDNIVNAIQVMQESMGIAGATADEAAGTISGSVEAMKSAWENLITGVADENANFEELVTQFVDSAMIAADNLIPRVEIALNGAGQMLDVVVPKIIDKIPEWIEKYLPKILESGVSIVLEIAAGLLKAVPDLIKMVPQLVNILVTTFKGRSADFKGIGKDIVTGVWNGISAMVSWFTGKVKSFFSGIVNSVKKTLGINSPSKVFASIGGYMAEGVGVGWDKEYDTVKSNIDKAMTFDKTKVNFKVGTVDYSNSGMGRTSGAAAAVASAARAAGENMTIVVQSVLDGKVIGETAYQYGKNKERMYGMA